MKICRKCLEVLTSLSAAIDSEGYTGSFILCCDWPDPIDIELGELADYEEAHNETGLDLSDLTEKEITILEYLAKEGRIIYGDTDRFERESTDSMVFDKQLWLDIL